MLNELYTFAEPVQVVPFSSLKWGKFTLLHTLPLTDSPVGDEYDNSGNDDCDCFFHIFFRVKL